MDTITLTEAQLDGWACIICGAEPAAMIPAGVGPRGQLFQCEEHRIV